MPCDQSIRFAERLRRAGVTVDLEIVPGADHFFDGAPDVEAIFERAVDFLHGTQSKCQRVTFWGNPLSVQA